jgi:hypothetical protein
MTRRKVGGDEQLADCPPKKAFFELPFPLDERLELLTEIARAAGYPASRKDLISALILSASDEGADLVALLTSFRGARAKQAEVRTRPDASVLVERSHKPGPRRRGPKK